MYVERVPNRNSPPAVLLRESYREGKKVKKRTLANLSKLPSEVVDNLRLSLKGAKVVNPEELPELCTVLRSLPHGHVAAVLGTINKLGIPQLIESKKTRSRDLAVAMIVSRIINPTSKLGTVRGIRAETASSSLGELLGLSHGDRNEYYEALDWLLSKQIDLENALVREELLRSTEKELDKIKTATQREKRALKGADLIGLRVGKVLNKFKVGKLFEIEISDSHFAYRRKSEVIEREKILDGVYIIRTSVESEKMDTATTIRAYKGLSKVEQAFRCLKTIDLKVRPIYHYLDHRVKGHIFLCFLAYYVEWHMRQALAPILFEEEEIENISSADLEELLKYQPSPIAKQKANDKRNQENLPVHSFSTLLNDLATITTNKIQINLQGERVTFDKITQPTALQQSCLDLLGVSLICTQ